MTIEPGRYRHYKGNFYQVLGVARHSETLEDHVVYQALYGERGLWIRPLTMFIETLVVDGRPQPRFAKVSEMAEGLTPDESQPEVESGLLQKTRRAFFRPQNPQS